MRNFMKVTAAVLILIVVLGGMTGQVAAIDSPEIDLNSPQNANTENITEINISVSTGDFGFDPELSDLNSNLTTTIYLDGEQITSKTKPIGESQDRNINLEYIFAESGSKNIIINSTWKVERLFGSDFTKSKTLTKTIDVAGTNTTDTAFAVPRSLQDEVAEYRENAPRDLGTHSFVLASQDELHIVFTQQQPTVGAASVEGIVLNRAVPSENLSFGAIVATNASYSTTGTETTVENVSENPKDYQRKLVRIDSHYRRVSTLTDPDLGEDFTLSTTAGVLVENPRTATSFFQNVGGKTRALAQNSSIDQTNSVQNTTQNTTQEIETLLNVSDQPSLNTVSFEEGFWADAGATVDGIVLDPQSAAQKFITEYDRTGIANTADGNPLLYIVDEDFESTSSDIETIKSQSESLDGDVVAVETNLYQGRISVQETLEETLPICGTDALGVYITQPPICIDLIQDNLLHTGVGWDTTPQSTEDILFVAGISTVHQDTPFEIKSGQYRIEGEVVSTSRIDESLPERSILLVTDLQRQGDINYKSIDGDARDIIEEQSTQLSSQLRHQVLGDAGSPELNTSASSITPDTATPNTSQEYNLTVTIEHTSLTNESGEVDIRFDDFQLETSKNDVTINYTAANISNGTLVISESITATAPDSVGVRAVNVTDLRVEDPHRSLIDDANITLGVVEMVPAESETIVVNTTDGVGDYNTIQSAINDATEGAVIEVHPGTYNEELIVNKNITVSGHNGATLEATSDLRGSAQYQVAIGVQIDNAVGPTNPEIRGLTITGYDYGIVAGEKFAFNGKSTGDWIVDNVTIQNIGFQENYDSGPAIKTKEATGRWKITNTDISTVSSYGIEAYGSTGEWSIENTTVTDTSIGIRATAADSNWKIQDTSIRNSSGYGLRVGSTASDWVLHNVTVTNSANGISAVRTAGDWSISDSRIQANTGDGINLVDPDGETPVTGSWIVNNSIIMNNSRDGINASTSEIEGNASYNYWGASDGPSGVFDGSGDTVVGNVSTTPYYTDASLTTLSETSITQAIDADNDGRIGDYEILQAIDYWRTGEVVPDTGGKTVSDFEVLKLIEKWRDGTRI